jgi:uncharacterized membrane-anchored protein YitT (DUF2179 family)
MWRTFRRPYNVVFALGSALLVFFATTSVGSFSLMSYIVRENSLPLSEKLSLLSHILRSPLYSPISAETMFLAILALLIGINITLTIFYIRLHQSAHSKTGTASSIGGLIASVLGIGCAACGSLILTSFAASVGGLGILSLLPHGGAEISYIGALLLIASCVVLVRGINTPAVCSI